MSIPEVGVRGHGSRFSMAYTSKHGGRVRLRLNAGSEVPVPAVLYGGVFMTCTDTGRHRAPTVEHYYEIINPPIGTQVITGTFAEDIDYEVRLVDDTWDSLVAPPAIGHKKGGPSASTYRRGTVR